MVDDSITTEALPGDLTLLPNQNSWTEFILSCVAKKDVKALLLRKYLFFVNISVIFRSIDKPTPSCCTMIRLAYFVR
jgi:hypothetical protein